MTFNYFSGGRADICSFTLILIRPRYILKTETGLRWTFRRALGIPWCVLSGGIYADLVSEIHIILCSLRFVQKLHTYQNTITLVLPEG